MFIGAFFAMTATWQDNDLTLRHIDVDEKEATSHLDVPRQNQDTHLFNTVLCISGVVWLL